MQNTCSNLNLNSLSSCSTMEENPYSRMWSGLYNTNRRRLQMDKALLGINNDLNESFKVYAQSEECEKCIMWHYGDVTPKLFPFKLEDITVNTTFGTYISVRNSSNLEVCAFKKHFGEYGEYNLSIAKPNGEISCHLTTVIDPINSYLPLLWAFIFYFLLAVLWLSVTYLYSKVIRPRLENNAGVIITDLGSPSDGSGVYGAHSSQSQAAPPQRSQRLKSLDTFRGISLVAMIFVNKGGGGYSDVFDHSVWNGLTVADLLFPWFMWIMGTSMVISQRSLLRKSYTKLHIFRKICKRSAILFLLGLVINTVGGYDLKTMRIFGVLQRFGICTIVVGTLELIFAKPEAPYQVVWWYHIQDLVTNWPQWVFIFMLIAVHTLITFLLPVPGCPKGYLGPGGVHMGGLFYNCTGGAAMWVDRKILTWNHMYGDPTCKKYYDTVIPHDPEGILGCLTSVVMVYLGVQCGKILVTYPRWQSRIKRWLIWAVATGALALLLCKASLNDGWIPINKNLWSLSFVLSLSSLAFIGLSACYFVIDVQKWWNGAPFFYAGMNSILLYVGHEITDGMFPWSWDYDLWTHSKLLAVNLWCTSLWVIIAMWAFSHKFFLKV